MIISFTWTTGAFLRGGLIMPDKLKPISELISENITPILACIVWIIIMFLAVWFFPEDFRE